MLKSAIVLAALIATPPAALATFTVYQGSPSAGNVLGTFDTFRQAARFARHHQGLGESIVNDATGKVVKEPGRLVRGNGSFHQGTLNANDSIKHSN